LVFTAAWWGTQKPPAAQHLQSSPDQFRHFLHQTSHAVRQHCWRPLFHDLPFNPGVGNSCCMIYAAAQVKDSVRSTLC
jgi:hypothetical protein